MKNHEVLSACATANAMQKGTGFVVVPLGRFAAGGDGQYNRVRIRHHDSDLLHWKEVATLELTAADTVSSLLDRVRLEVDRVRARWRWDRIKAEHRLLRQGRTVDL